MNEMAQFMPKILHQSQTKQRITSLQKCYVYSLLQLLNKTNLAANLNSFLVTRKTSQSRTSRRPCSTSHCRCRHRCHCQSTPPLHPTSSHAKPLAAKADYGLATELEIAKTTLTTRTCRVQKPEIQGDVVCWTVASVISRRKSKEQSNNGAFSTTLYTLSTKDLDELATELEIAETTLTTRTCRVQKPEIQGGVVRWTAASVIRWRKSKEQSGNSAALEQFLNGEREREFPYGIQIFRGKERRNCVKEIFGVGSTKYFLRERVRSIY
ncbi:hypothetical protein EUGRSUZ_I00919 [Eucalyptus grandis]|uniref:Uncharacterized protein n=2 Tax=Eucalyptus grandis TaxID=71139 RepID=A0ACC3JG62_EUCGR|nr:hypothetical protein EUGRSUZ_I00919 [Eucalyptus grandis]